MSVLVAAALLAVPFVGVPPAAPVLGELSDGDLVFHLAARMGWVTERPVLVLPPIPPGETVASVALRLGDRAGLPTSVEDVRAFDALHPELAAPTLVLLLAVERAWDGRDASFAALSVAEQRELARLLEDPAQWNSPRFVALSSEVDMEPLINAAILLLDTIDSVVLPALQTATDNAVWPPLALADPPRGGHGVLRIGSAGNDIETAHRLVQLDGTGNDQWRNNAGGTKVAQDLDPLTYDYPVSVHIDLAGNDVYKTTALSAQGGGDLGIGILLDLGGDDEYRCLGRCQGTGSGGLGFARDSRGTDKWIVEGNIALAVGWTGLGVMREDSGDDYYFAESQSGGYGQRGIGLLWDRGGTDEYDQGTISSSYGYSDPGGHGWLVDEGPELDTYHSMNDVINPRGCNNCQWNAGDDSPPHGYGNDNYGGLAYLLEWEATHP